MFPIPSQAPLQPLPIRCMCNSLGDPQGSKPNSGLRGKGPRAAPCSLRLEAAGAGHGQELAGAGWGSVARRQLVSLSSLLSGAHLITGPTPGARPGSFWGPTGAAEPVCEKQASGPIE